MTDPTPVQRIGPISPGESLGKISKPSSDSDGPSFADVMKNSIKEVNALQKEADLAIQDLALGKTENVTEVLTAVEKADLAFRHLMQIRNKLLDAYEEINRLRV